MDSQKVYILGHAQIEKVDSIFHNNPEEYFVYFTGKKRADKLRNLGVHVIDYRNRYYICVQYCASSVLKKNIDRCSKYTCAFAIHKSKNDYGSSYITLLNVYNESTEIETI